jgi:hypothetical protein
MFTLQHSTAEITTLKYEMYSRAANHYHDPLKLQTHFYCTIGTHSQCSLPTLEFNTNAKIEVFPLHQRKASV